MVFLSIASLHRHFWEEVAEMPINKIPVVELNSQPKNGFNSLETV